jgi:RimJ/RimL family protein N-acetyltransferase
VVDPSFDHLLTQRLVVRRFVAADADVLAAYRSDPAVARYQSWDAPFTIDQARAFITWLLGHHPDEPGEWHQLAIVTRDSPGELIGDCAFHSRRDEPAIADIGFTLGPPAQGHGYATEAVGALLRYLFETRRKHRVVANCDTRNVRSAALLERLGFRREGELRESYRDGSAWASEYHYGLLEHEWRDGAGHS